LLAELDELYPRYAAVLADSNSARIFVVGPGLVIVAEHLDGKKVHRVKVGGWSQARYPRRASNAHHEHAKEVIERLAQIVHEDKISYIVLAGDHVVVPLLQEQLRHYMVPMVQVMKLDIHASDKDFLAATSRHASGETLARLLQLSCARGLAVTGPRETFGAMIDGRVEELLISGGTEESQEGRTVPMPDQLVTRARQTGAAVTFIEDASLLESVGGAGGFLRWRE